VTGRFGQRHQDLLEFFLWNTERRRVLADGGIEILVDPARVRRTMSSSGYTYEALSKLVRELREVTIELRTSVGMFIIGGLVDHVVISEATVPNPLTGGDRHKWRVRLGVAMVALLLQDPPLYYDPAPIASLSNGFSKAVARFLIGQTTVPKGGWIIDRMIRRLCGELDSVGMRHRRRELRVNAEYLATVGFVIEGDRIFKRGVVEAGETAKRAAPARENGLL
jgi:hypothetical protein